MRPPNTMATAERWLWSRLDKSGECWLWTGGRSPAGYGRVSVKGCKSPQTTHRIAWILTNGEIPDGIFVCHNCPGGDNPSCCRPSHLFLGTAMDNNHDGINKKLGRAIYQLGQPVQAFVRHPFSIQNWQAQVIRQMADERVCSESEIVREIITLGLQERALIDQLIKARYA